MNAADSEIFISLRHCSMEEEECQLIHPAARSAGHTFQRGLLRFQPLSTLQKGGKCYHWACAGFSKTCGEAFTEHSPNHNTDRSFQVLPSTFYTYVWEPQWLLPMVMFFYNSLMSPSQTLNERRARRVPFHDREAQKILNPKLEAQEEGSYLHSQKVLM